MIFKGLKENSIKKAIKASNLKPANYGGDAGAVRSLAIIINYDTLVDYKPLMDIAKAIRISNDNIFIAGYVDRIYKNVNYMIPVFSQNSFGINGKVKQEDIQAFLDRPYDIAINYYSTPNLFLKYVSTLCKSELKVGITEGSENVNNLVLKVNEKDYDQFSKELVKYLNILKRL
ncbi:DUF6913 domain-containing protein [Galbibacter sp.]|jgi:hypothetical protein|uniref:DUF6913 domain-containing protein n=1 Tax=Galbibacter sp. TaxID=2918471 RepID=UPI003A8E8D7A